MMRKCVRLLSGVGFAALLCGVAVVVRAQPTLGTAQSFAVLGRLDGHQHRPERDHGRSRGQPGFGHHRLSLQGTVNGHDPRGGCRGASGAERSHHLLQFACQCGRAPRT